MNVSFTFTTQNSEHSRFCFAYGVSSQIMQNLPKKLNKDPLVDGVFEIRFSSQFPVGGVLPGLLFGKLTGDKAIETLPMSQIPQAIRDAEPNLKFAPLNRLNWERFYINIGDRSVSIGFKHPYPSWKVFEPAIIQVMDALKGANLISSVERYSLKYINLLPSSDIQEQLSFVNLDVTLADHKLQREALQLRLEIPSAKFIHAVQLVSSTTVVLHTGESRQGLIIDIDTIANQGNISFDELLDQFSHKLTEIHLANKEMFFSCLKGKTIENMEAEYE